MNTPLSRVRVAMPYVLICKEDEEIGKPWVLKCTRPYDGTSSGEFLTGIPTKTNRKRFTLYESGVYLVHRPFMEQIPVEPYDVEGEPRYIFRASFERYYLCLNEQGRVQQMNFKEAQAVLRALEWAEMADEEPDYDQIENI
jgi:hypothetical protein